MNRNPIGWFEIYVQDLDRAKKFYEQVLGIELSKLESPMPELEMLAFPMNMEAGGASVRAREDGRVPIRWHGHTGLFHLRRLCERIVARSNRRRQAVQTQVFDRAVRVHRDGDGHRRQHGRITLHEVEWENEAQTTNHPVPVF